MEKVLDVYKQPYDPQIPVVCMDESPKQLIAETRIPIPASPGEPERHDYEYERRRTCNIFVAVIDADDHGPAVYHFVLHQRIAVNEFIAAVLVEKGIFVKFRSEEAAKLRRSALNWTIGGKGEDEGFNVHLGIQLRLVRKPVIFQRF